MELLRFLLEGNHPASIAGIVIILTAMIVAFLRRGVDMPLVVLFALGGLFTAITFIHSFKAGKDAIEVITGAGNAAATLATKFEAHEKTTATAIGNLNSQIATVAQTQKELANRLAELQKAGQTGAIDFSKLQFQIETQDKGLIESFKQNQKLIETLRMTDPKFQTEIDNLKATIGRLDHSERRT